MNNFYYSTIFDYIYIYQFLCNKFAKIKVTFQFTIASSSVGSDRGNLKRVGREKVGNSLPDQ